MSITHKRGRTFTALRTLTATAVLGMTIGSGGGSTPTAPSLKGSAVGSFGNGGARTTTTLPSVAVGDLILAWGSAYDGVATPVNVTMQDSANGTFADSSNTYAAALATPLNVVEGGSDYMTFNGWSAVAQANVTTLTLGVGAGNYRAIMAVNMGQVFDAARFDDGGTRKSILQYTGVGTAPTVNNDTTTYSHCYVIAGFAHYQSAVVPTQFSDWAILLAVGDNDNNRMTLVGKAVTTIGDYDPALQFPGSPLTQVGGISFVVKGKNT